MGAFEKTLVYLSTITLLLAGIFFIYEGSTYLQMKKSNPSIPNKMYVAASCAIALGAFEIIFAFVHIFLFSDTLEIPFLNEFKKKIMAK